MIAGGHFTRSRPGVRWRAAFAGCLLFFAVISGRAGASVIDTTPSWNGTLGVASLGGFEGSNAYGQTVTVPAGEPVLNSFTFYVRLVTPTPGDVAFRAEVYAWDAVNLHATGPALYESGTVHSTSGTFQPITFDTGGVTLVPGAQYVLFGTSNKDPQGGSRTAWGEVGTSPYAGGTFYFQNNDSFADVTTKRWVARDFDLAFKATFSPPNRPPDCSSVAAGPSVIRLATRHKFKTIALSGATDPDGDAVTYHVDGVTQDEPVSGKGIGDPSKPDADQNGTAANEVRVRAERNPQSNGRVYRIAYTVTDAQGASCSATAATTGAKVAVPRHKRTPAVDDGDAASWNSFTGEALSSPLRRSHGARAERVHAPPGRAARSSTKPTRHGT
jgi:hypothetical protein